MRSDTASRLTAGTVNSRRFVALCNDFLMLNGQCWRAAFGARAAGSPALRSACPRWTTAR